MIRKLSDADVLMNLSQVEYKAKHTYKAFYSSLVGGWTDNPNLMLVPLDDHIVHRGDGIFEAMKSLNQKIYLLGAHLDRLKESASRIELKLPFSRNEMESIIQETLQASNLPDALIRLFVSRGPGGFSTNPQECVSSQLYLIVMELPMHSEERYQLGVTAGPSEVAPKQGWMAQVKSCNYLPNVMMKIDSIKRGWDFAIGFDQRGFVTEGPTENIAILDSRGAFVYPKFESSLRGTTLSRLIEIIERDQLCPHEQKDLGETDILSAKEVFLIGTGFDLIGVVRWKGQPISSGAVGPWAHRFRRCILQDQRS